MLPRSAFGLRRPSVPPCTLYILGDCGRHLHRGIYSLFFRSRSKQLTMIRAWIFFAFATLLPGVLSASHCTATQECWPSADTWSAFNSSIGGRLVAPRPPAWPCHDPNYDETACNEAKANWGNSFWRSNQTGAMQNPVWDSPGCSLDTPRNVACDQGLVPIYSVVAESGDDVSKAVQFAGTHKLRVVVKNTGHDFLGRSSGEDSFSIWTHKLKGIEFTDSFVPSGCSNNTSSSPAVTVGAAEQWLDVYKAADERRVIVVGGAARSVGAAGGWVQGGGHSPLGGMYGMGVDNVLQFTIVKPNGEITRANACQDEDLFWALRGGGGGTWGVTLDVTYKTHPPLDGAVALGMIINTTNSGKLTELSEVFLQALPNITDQGLRGYGFWEPPNMLAFLLFHPNSPSVGSTNNTLGQIHNWIARNNGTTVQQIATFHSTFYEMFNTYIQDGSIGVPIWFGTRLVSKNAFKTKSKELVKYIFGDGERLGASINIVGGGAISEMDPDSTGLNPQWRQEALVSWTFGGGWYSNSTSAEIKSVKKATTKIVQDFGKVAGLDDAAYLNEADPHEPQWKKAFFGTHYERLSNIKKKVDPSRMFTCNRCVGADV